MEHIQEDDIKHAIDTLTKAFHQRAKNAGWWTVNGKDRPTDINSREGLAEFAICMMNLVGEISEAWEYARIGDKQSEKIPNYTGIEEEFSDIIMRLCDTAEGFGIDLSSATVAKILYNLSRKDHKLENRNMPGGKKV